jgi:antitoxin MazE
MIAKLIQIGNSKGIRIPKAVIEKYQLLDELEIIESKEGFLIKPVSKVRDGWDEIFKAENAKNSVDEDFSDFMQITNEFDQTEWK